MNENSSRFESLMNCKKISEIEQRSNIPKLNQKIGKVIYWFAITFNVLFVCFAITVSMVHKKLEKELKCLKLSEWLKCML